MLKNFKKRVKKFNEDSILKRNVQKQSDSVSDDIILFFMIFSFFYSSSQIMNTIGFIFGLEVLSIPYIFGSGILFAIGFIGASYLFLAYKALQDALETGKKA